MFSGFVDTVLGFVQQYGYLAVFAYMVLETSFILHFAPSEIVVPFAASQLVHGPLSFALFVVDTTIGATLGSVLAYYVFGHYGGDVVERYGHVVHVSERDFERGQKVFVRYGESSVFWGRMLPFVRALISIPAGLAEMSVGRFVAYSAAGALFFNIALTYLVYTSAGSPSPLEVMIEVAVETLGPQVAYLAAHLWLVVVLLGLVATLAWLGRERIREHPVVDRMRK